ncbi:MAG: hypothetical protein WCY30_00115 [Candidatus Neomarinimicrobiota bacterium]|jgi:hypothetical protein
MNNKLNSLVSKGSEKLTPEQESLIQQKLAEGQIMARGFLAELEKEGGVKQFAGKLLGKGKRTVTNNWTKLVNALSPTRMGGVDKKHKIMNRTLGKVFAGTALAGGVAAPTVGTVMGIKALKKRKAEKEAFVLTDKTAEAYQFGVDLVMGELEKAASGEKPTVDIKVVNKLAEHRAQKAMFQDRIKVAAIAYEDIAEKVAEAGNEKLAEEILKYAEGELSEAIEEAGDLAVSPEVVEAEEEPTEEEIEEAAIQGAADVIADMTGKEPDDPEVQEAAAEVVQEAVAAQ